MVGEDRVGEDLDAAKLRHLPELLTQYLFGCVVEEVLAVHRAGDAVVDCFRVPRLDLDSRRSHGRENCWVALIVVGVATLTDTDAQARCPASPSKLGFNLSLTYRLRGLTA